MIGGQEKTFDINGHSGVLSQCAGVIADYWPHARFADASGECANDTLDDIDELFAYESAEVARQWNELGASPKLANTMIHLLLAHGELTLVADDLSISPIDDIVESLNESLAPHPQDAP